VCVRTDMQEVHLLSVHVDLHKRIDTAAAATVTTRKRSRFKALLRALRAPSPASREAGVHAVPRAFALTESKTPGQVQGREYGEGVKVWA
jgi:hypothetical protein